MYCSYLFSSAEFLISTLYYIKILHIRKSFVIFFLFYQGNYNTISTIKTVFFSLFMWDFQTDSYLFFVVGIFPIAFFPKIGYIYS